MQVTKELAEKKCQTLMSKFFHRQNVAAISVNGKPRPIWVNQETLAALIKSHVYGYRVPPAYVRDGYGCEHSGPFRVGAYTLAEDNTVSWGCIDLDAGQAKSYPLKDLDHVAITISSIASERGLPHYIEVSASGCGRHIWFFFDRPVYAGDVRRLLFSLITQRFELLKGGFSDPKGNRGIEIFPKQSQLSERGIGNMVWVPWWFGANPGCCEFIKLGGANVR
jgi:hypothetical protein